MAIEIRDNDFQNPWIVVISPKLPKKSIVLASQIQLKLLYLTSFHPGACW